MPHILRGHRKQWGHWATTGLSPWGWVHWGHQTTMCLSPLVQGDNKVPRPLGTLGTPSHKVSRSLQLRRRQGVTVSVLLVVSASFRDTSGTSVPWVTAVTRCPCPSGTLGTSSCDESQSLGLGYIALRRISMPSVGDVEDIEDVGDVWNTGDVRATGDGGDTGDTEPRCVSVPQTGDISQSLGGALGHGGHRAMTCPSPMAWDTGGIGDIGSWRVPMSWVGDAGDIEPHCASAP